MPSLLVADLGVLAYGPALELQREVARRRIAGDIADDVLLLVEHPHVVTLGRASRQASLVATPELLAARGVELFEVERGGDVTYHGPGQLVGYPVVDLKRHRQDLHWYLRQVEEALIVTARQWSIAGWRNPGYTGVWVGQQHDDAPALPPPTPTLTPTTHSATPRKLASIGVHARDWVTWHGFALNVATDLSYFDVMVPCGIADVVMTSMEREFGGDVEMRAVKDRVAQAFGDLFSLVPAPAPQNLIPVTG